MYYLIYKGKRCQIFDNEEKAKIYNQFYYAQIKEFQTLEEAKEFLNSYNHIKNGYVDVHFTFCNISNDDYQFIKKKLNLQQNKLIFYTPDKETIQKTKEILDLESKKKEYLKNVIDIKVNILNIEKDKEDLDKEYEKLELQFEKLKKSYIEENKKLRNFQDKIIEIDEKLNN